MSNLAFDRYRRKQIAELRPWTPGDDMTAVSVSSEDVKAGSPRAGDMVARNPKNHADQWLVSAAYFADNFEPVVPVVVVSIPGGDCGGTRRVGQCQPCPGCRACS